MPICRRETLKQPRGEERRGNRFSCRAKRGSLPARQIVSARPYPCEESYSAAIHCRRSDYRIRSFHLFERRECAREYMHSRITLVCARSILNWKARGRVAKVYEEHFIDERRMCVCACVARKRIKLDSPTIYTHISIYICIWQSASMFLLFSKCAGLIISWWLYRLAILYTRYYFWWRDLSTMCGFQRSIQRWFFVTPSLFTPRANTSVEEQLILLTRNNMMNATRACIILRARRSKRTSHEVRGHTPRMCNGLNSTSWNAVVVALNSPL